VTDTLVRVLFQSLQRIFEGPVRRRPADADVVVVCVGPSHSRRDASPALLVEMLPAFPGDDLGDRSEMNTEPLCHLHTLVDVCLAAFRSPTTASFECRVDHIIDCLSVVARFGPLGPTGISPDR
jgi:hypothetical protein